MACSGGTDNLQLDHAAAATTVAQAFPLGRSHAGQRRGLQKPAEVVASELVISVLGAIASAPPCPAGWPGRSAPP